MSIKINFEDSIIIYIYIYNFKNVILHSSYHSTYIDYVILTEDHTIFLSSLTMLFDFGPSIHTFLNVIWNKIMIRINED